MGSRTDHDPVNHACMRALFNRRAALKAWTRKYFMVASIFRGENLEQRIGTSARVLSSNPTQIMNHFSDETTIIVPETTVRNKKVDTIWCIELEGNLTLNNLIIS